MKCLSKSSPNISLNMNETYLMVIRKLLTIVASMLVARGLLPETAMDNELIVGLAGVILLGLSTIWSNSNKKKIVVAKEIIGEPISKTNDP